jgi:hypothetical protein
MQFDNLSVLRPSPHDLAQKDVITVQPSDLPMEDT